MSIENQLKTYPIPVPNTLEMDVLKQLNDLSAKKKKSFPWFKYLATSAASVIIILTLLTAFVHPFQVFASEMPGLNLLAQLFTDDRGIKSAKEHNYPSDSFVYEADGYEILVTDMVVDEDRITMKASISSPFIDVPFYTSWNMMVNEEFSVLSMTQTNEESSNSAIIEGNFILPIDKIMDPNLKGITLQELLLESATLNLVLNLYHQPLEDSSTLAFKTLSVPLPLDGDNVSYSKVYNLNHTVTLEEGDIRLEQLIISPTRARLVVYCSPHPGYKGIDLKDFSISGEFSTMKTGPGLISTGNSNGYRSYYLTPSSYFSESPQSMELNISTYAFSYDNQSFTLSQDKIPYTISSGDTKIIIDEFSYDNGVLELSSYAKDYSNFDWFGLTLIDAHEESRTEYVSEAGSTIKRIEQTFKEVSPQEAYHFELLFDHYYIYQPSTILLELKE